MMILLLLSNIIIDTKLLVLEVEDAQMLPVWHASKKKNSDAGICKQLFPVCVIDIFMAVNDVISNLMSRSVQAMGSCTAVVVLYSKSVCFVRCGHYF